VCKGLKQGIGEQGTSSLYQSYSKIKVMGAEL